MCGLARCGKWPVAVRFGGAQPVSGSVGTFALGSSTDGAAVSPVSLVKDAYGAVVRGV